MRLRLVAILLALCVAASTSLATLSAATVDSSGPVTLVPGQVTITGIVDPCPAGAAHEAQCQSFTVSCPNTSVSDATGIVAITTPQNPRGTIILHNGGSGNTFLNNGFADYYAFNQYNVVQVEWTNDWADAGGVGVTSAACRPAGVYQWVYANVHDSSTSLPFCGQGTSGGGATFTHALANYGMDALFDYIVIAAGPAVTRLDYGCTGRIPQPTLTCTQPSPPLQPGIVPYAYSFATRTKVDRWENPQERSCGINIDFLDKWHTDSVINPTGNYVYPNTQMTWFFCVDPPTLNESTGQGAFLISQVRPKGALDVYCYNNSNTNDGCTGEGVWESTDAVTATENEMIGVNGSGGLCKPNHQGRR